MTGGSALSINCAARTMVPPLYGRLIARWRDTVDGATVVGRDPAFIQPVDPRVLY